MNIFEMIHGMVYTQDRENNENMETTRVFTNGRSQAVRIPKAYRFETDEVYINKIGEVVMLAPKDSLAKIFDDGIDMLTDDFLSEGLPEEIDAKREQP